MSNVRYFDIPNQFEPYNILFQHIQADLKDLQENQNKAQEKQKKQTKALQKKNETKDGFCNKYFSYIIIAIFVGLISIMVMLKMTESDYFFTSKYEIKDYYGLVGTHKGATIKEIKSAYRKAVKKWHPDRNPTCGEECRVKMSEINEAYLILLNPETRAFHDKHGTEVPANLVKLAKEKSGTHRGKDI